MRVKIFIDPEIEEEVAELHVRAVTEEVSRISDMIQRKDAVVTGIDQNGRIVIVNPGEVFSVHAEKKWCTIHTETDVYGCRKRLYEMENLLGSDFMRASKSIIINLKKIKSVEPVFNGMMLLHMKNGSKEYVSRTYLPALKGHLGI